MKKDQFKIVVDEGEDGVKINAKDGYKLGPVSKSRDNKYLGFQVTGAGPRYKRSWREHFDLVDVLFWLFLLAGMLVLFLYTLPANASSIACGVRPIPPIGCSDSDAVCECDENGECEWVWECR